MEPDLAHATLMYAIDSFLVGQTQTLGFWTAGWIGAVAIGTAQIKTLVDRIFEDADSEALPMALGVKDTGLSRSEAKCGMASYTLLV
ncbi:hypothetical protein BG011_007819 [Mortierella polycephala]|uniref:Uncharacterized protein n=1 Tax=Mortierella polycephala TaxID=41804 RepID=A0A9P6PSD3_9FUNG|nr:hypothetical protein BG011_007819 [Mortierella polycephala]